MTATIRVTEAQRDAAQLIVERSAKLGRPVRPAVAAIAQAASSVGLRRRTPRPGPIGQQSPGTR
jgi:hypothetical protein